MRRGAPIKFTEKARKAFCKAIAGGNTRIHACLSAGVRPRTVRAWIARGRRQQSGEYVAFIAAFEKARGAAIARNVAAIQAAARRNWKAAAWWLERRFPEQYGRRVKVERRDTAVLELVEEIVVAKPPADRPGHQATAPGTNGVPR